MKYIRIEEKKIMKKNKLTEKLKTNRIVLFTDMTTQSTGIMSEYELKQNYHKMVGTSEGKVCYMEKIR